MAQRNSEPDLTGMDVEANNWHSDKSQGVDHELIFDEELQYCFIVVSEEPLVLDFMAHAIMGEEKLRGHPDLHEYTVPREVCKRFVGETIAQTDDSEDTCGRYTITGIAATELRGDDDGDVPEHEATIFEVEGNLDSQEELTAFDLIRGLVTGAHVIVESDEGEANE